MATEYAHRVGTIVAATVGSRFKHWHVEGVTWRSSSRDAAAFGVGLSTALKAARLHATINSLSLDFIAASAAALCEGGAFEDIGKRGIWASSRLAAAAPRTVDGAIAPDAGMAHDAAWVHGALDLERSLRWRRIANGPTCPLPCSRLRGCP